MPPGITEKQLEIFKDYVNESSVYYMFPQSETHQNTIQFLTHFQMETLPRLKSIEPGCEDPVASILSSTVLQMLQSSLLDTISSAQYFCEIYPYTRFDAFLFEKEENLHYRIPYEFHGNRFAATSPLELALQGVLSWYYFTMLLEEAGICLHRFVENEISNFKHREQHAFLLRTLSKIDPAKYFVANCELWPEHLDLKQLDQAFPWREVLLSLRQERPSLEDIDRMIVGSLSLFRQSLQYEEGLSNGYSGMFDIGDEGSGTSDTTDGESSIVEIVDEESGISIR